MTKAPAETVASTAQRRVGVSGGLGEDDRWTAVGLVQGYFVPRLLPVACACDNFTGHADCFKYGAGSTPRLEGSQMKRFLAWGAAVVGAGSIASCSIQGLPTNSSGGGSAGASGGGGASLGGAASAGEAGVPNAGEAGVPNAGAGGTGGVSPCVLDVSKLDNCLLQ